MKIELVDEKNYNMLVEWWKGHEWPIIPFDSLPKTGIIVNDIVAGFLYSSDSNVCMLEWIISDPNSDKEKRKESLNILIDKICHIAKDMGFKYCFTFVKNKGLINTLKENSFNKTDEEMIHFVRSL
jgi:hypothetical protein